MAKPMLNMPVPKGLKNAIEEAAKKMGSSQAEIVRIALYHYLEIHPNQEAAGRK